MARCWCGRKRARSSTPRALGRLREVIEKQRPVAFIADPLSELHGEEENDNTALRAVIAEFRKLAIEFDMAVIILHHTRKGSSASPGDPDAARGASSILGAVRIALTLGTMGEEDAKQFGLPTDHKARSGYVRLDDAKQNYAPIREAEWFEKHVYELDNGEAVAAAVPWQPPVAKVASKDDLAALAVAIERGSPGGEPWSPKLCTEPRSVRALLEQHGFIGTDCQKKVMEALKDNFALESARYQGSQRKPRSGLRIGEHPSAEWFGIEGIVE